MRIEIKKKQPFLQKIMKLFFPNQFLENKEDKIQLNEYEERELYWLL